MLIETWVAALFVVLIFIIGVIGLLGWILADQRLEKLIEENKELRKENARLENKIRLMNLYKTLKEYEK